jgi:hypothetical protein
VPKTYNQREINQMRLDAEYAPPVPDEPDVMRFIRYFHPDDVRQIADRMERRVAAGKITHIKPETAYLVVKALRMWNAEPKRESIVREICGVPGGCPNQCLACIGKANAIMQLYEGRKVR